MKRRERRLKKRRAGVRKKSKSGFIRGKVRSFRVRRVRKVPQHFALR